MKNQQTTNSNDLFYIEFEKGQSDFITPEQLQSISEDLKQRKFEGKITSLKKIKPLSEQKFELSDLIFHLRTNTELLEVLLQQAFKLDDKPQNYFDLMNQISHFISSNIISISQSKVSDLNSVIEHYESNN